jgi:hypothetical protein
MKALTDSASIKGDAGEMGEAHPILDARGDRGGLTFEIGGLIGDISEVKGGLIGLMGLIRGSSGLDAVFFFTMFRTC